MGGLRDLQGLTLEIVETSLSPTPLIQTSLPVSILERSPENVNFVRVERGVKRFKMTRRCLIFGANSLEWLLSLSKGDWSEILWLPSPDMDSEEKLLVCEALRLLEGRSIQVEDALDTSKNVDVLLGGGEFKSWSKLLSRCADSSVVLAINDGHQRRVVGRWSRVLVTHEIVGGVTDWFGTLLARHWFIPPLPDSVRRNLGHVLDHGDRPSPCSASLDFPHLSTASLLPIKESLLVDVAFHTYASRTGWGRRKLNRKEIAGAMDLPLWFSTSSSFDRWCQRFELGRCLPLKPFQSVMKLFLKSVSSGDDVASGPALPRKLPAALLPLVQDDFWIDALGKMLPGSWVQEGVISDKAAKSDDAKIHTGLWDQRVTLVIPSITENDLELVRPLFYLCWCRRLIKCFKRFMNQTHGHDWVSRLFQLRRQRQLGATSQVSPQRGGDLYFKGDENLDKVEFLNVAKSSLASSELLADGDMGATALSKALNASWWEWNSGSALFFWRWDPSQRGAARDGMEIFVRGKLPKTIGAGRGTRQDKRSAVGKKLNKVFERGYILPGLVKSTIDFFDVEKGSSDIRVVYNGTSCGLNDALFAPSFWLPNAATASRPLMPYSWMADADMGEMFPNFPMDKKIHSVSGIDVTQLQEYMPNLPKPEVSGSRNKIHLRWERLFMGMKPSPYNAVRYFYWAEELARGNPEDSTNPFHYSEVTLNLPGMESYDPTSPHVFKWNSSVERIAGEVVTFIDDMRACGFSKENTWQIIRRLTSVLQHLGIQDAPRKRRPSCQSPGGWIGCINKVTPEMVALTVSQEKWEKGQRIIFSLAKECLGVEELPDLLHKRLEKDRGFLTHLAMTFSSLVPLLKGFHLTLDQWRVNREKDGWARPEKEHRDWMQVFYHQHQGQEEFMWDFLNAGAPTTVKPVPRFIDDLKGLTKIFGAKVPPIIVLRSVFVYMVVYGFGDASGTGFGSTFSRDGDISYRIGIWADDESDESSNWRELTNVVESLEDEAEGGRLANTVVYFFTDNNTAEAAIYKGSSTSRKLLGLVIRLKVLEVEHSIHLTVCHVAGSRMIAEGGDGVSRGLLNEGVMSGESILSFIPLHLSAIDRCTHLLPWIYSWVGEKLEVLTPKDWYQLGHDIRGWADPKNGEPFSRPLLRKGVFGWFPPPSCADVALEQLRMARIKRQDSSHVFVVPRLLTPRWLKQLWKACDVVLSVPAGTQGWPVDMYEPVLIGICFPFLSFNPWQFRGTPKMFSMARKLRGVFKENELDAGTLLRKFWKSSHRMLSMQEDVVSRMLYFFPKSNVSHCQKRGRSNRSDGLGGRRGSNDVGVAPKEKRRRRV